MECYAGILLLTTNHVGDFDEAFASHIHVNLDYPELNQSKTIKIFTVNPDMIENRFRERISKLNLIEWPSVTSQALNIQNILPLGRMAGRSATQARPL